MAKANLVSNPPARTAQSGFVRRTTLSRLLLISPRIGASRWMRIGRWSAATRACATEARERANALTAFRGWRASTERALRVARRALLRMVMVAVAIPVVRCALGTGGVFP